MARRVKSSKYIEDPSLEALNLPIDDPCNNASLDWWMDGHRWAEQGNRLEKRRPRAFIYGYCYAYQTMRLKELRPWCTDSCGSGCKDWESM